MGHVQPTWEVPCDTDTRPAYRTTNVVLRSDRQPCPVSTRHVKLYDHMLRACVTAHLVGLTTRTVRPNDYVCDLDWFGRWPRTPKFADNQRRGGVTSRMLENINIHVVWTRLASTPRKAAWRAKV